MKNDNGILTINRDDYETINGMFRIIDNLRACSLRKYGNTCIGVKKIEAIIELIKEEKIDYLYDETSGCYEISDEEGLLKELEAIIGFMTGIDVIVFRAWYDHEKLCPGDCDHIYLVWNSADKHNIETALHTNELIHKKNKRMRYYKRANKDITRQYKLS